MLLAATTAFFFITTLLLAFRPQSAPIRTSGTRAASEAQTERAIETVTMRFMTNLVNYDFEAVETTIRKVLGDATESFETEFQSALGGDINNFRSRIRSQQVNSTGEVLAVAVTELEDDTATAVAIVRQTTRSLRRPEGRSSFRALELAVARVQGRWKVDNVSNPAQPSQ